MINESADDVLVKVKEIVRESNSKISLNSIDRAHRIGKAVTNSNGKESQSIIVRFTSFRERTAFYRARKNIDNGLSIRLDLTRKRYNLLKTARKESERIPSVNYIYADINCRIKAKLMDDDEKFIESLADLKNLQ